MDCRPRLMSSIYPWFRIRVYFLLDGLPTKAVELHLPGFGIRICPSPRLCRSTAPYSVLFRCNPPKGGLPHPPPRGRAPTPYSPSARLKVQVKPVSILNHFVKTSHIHNYRTRSVSSESFYVKFSRTDKMYAFFSRIGAQIWNSIPFSIKLLKRSSFRKKIKELLLNFLRSEDDYVEVSGLIKLFNTLG